MVNIRIKGNKETNEYQDALVLKQLFENDFSKEDVNGTILIISNATLFGQETKDVDLIVIGNFEKYSCRVKSKAKKIVNKEYKEFEAKEYEELESKERNIYVNNFCFVIETKRHRAEDIQINGLNLLVKYNDKLSDVTTQSEKQKYSLKEFFNDRLNTSPYICNFIWFRAVSLESIRGLLGNNVNILTKHNYLPNVFTFKSLIELACVQEIPYNPIDKVTGNPKGYSSFDCLKWGQSFDFAHFQQVFDVFEKIREGTGQLTRKKIEQITSKLLDQQQYAQAIGEKLIIVSGRAGTGKTIKILRIACDLAINSGGRCLILTYNHALVSDIKRTLALAEIPDGIDSYTVAISTLHKFLFELIIGFGIVKNEKDPEANVKFIPDYIKKYPEYLKQLSEYIESGIIEEKEIQELMRSRHDTIAWDYVLVDEAQDWSEIERSILFKIFGYKRIIIADGIDQLIRSQQKCNWARGLKKDVDFKQTFEKKGLRQEVHLVSFVNAFARKVGIVWELEPKSELIGGKVIISTSGYTKELHQRELQRCKENGNSEYEMMFLVPPRMVNKIKKEDKYGNVSEVRSFKHIEDFQKMGIDIWDGTNTDLRTQYVVELNQHRFLQYESCRGLEGWTVVCLELDEFVKSKMEHFVEQETTELALESFSEKRDKFVYLWSLIPLTRAIDTLVITINDKQSKVCQALRAVYKENPDYIQWID